MDQTDQSEQKSLWEHDLDLCQKMGYRDFFMKYSPMRAKIFLTPKVFQYKPDIAEKALKGLKSIAWTNVIEELSEAMYSVRALGQSLSADLFEANPILAEEALNIFKHTFSSPSDSVRNATIKETRDLIFSSINDGDRRQNEHILIPLLAGIYHSRKNNAPYVVNTAKAVITELKEELKWYGSYYSGFEIDSLAHAILTKDIKNSEQKDSSEIPAILEGDL
ncbi:MAG: hypothetical protein PHE21_00260 [Candidatus Dojkabacteria bacterium]|nr:hypothetical protein [Candidatus Dojkabacteria bacterium]